MIPAEVGDRYRRIMQSGRKSCRRTVSAVVALGISLGLTACSYVDRIAIRVNEDHSVACRRGL